MRAGTAQDTIEFLDTYRAGLRDEVLARVPPDALEAIQGSGRTAWVPVEHDVMFVNAIVEHLRSAEAVALIRASVGQHFSGPLLRTLVKGAQRIFGMTPMGLMKMVPRAWPMVYKGFGRPSFVAADDKHAILAINDAHPLAYTAEGYLASWEGIFAGIVDVGTNHKAQAVRVNVEIDADAPRFEIHTRWT